MLDYREVAPRERVIVALDCSLDEALDLGRKLQGRAVWMKVGMTLYYAHGPAAVRALKDLGFKVFLDLKLHDIPHQVEGAAYAACASGADMITMHACGGVPMMEAAVRGCRRAVEELELDSSPITLGVTVLTSMDGETLSSVGVERSLSDQVDALALLTKIAGLSGLVASPLEAERLRSLLGDGAYIVTPGIRPAGSAKGDQHRIATPASAVAAGSSHLVIGRPITQADDPVAAYEAIIREIGDL